MKKISKVTCIVFLIGASLLSACSQVDTLTAEPSIPSTPLTPLPTASPEAVTYSLGHFPDVPTGSLPDSITSAMQAVLDDAVKNGLPGVTATVLAADGEAWSGAAGTADGVNPMQVRSQFAICSITKTVIAAEIMWLSEQGMLRLSDPVSEHLPPSFHFDTNGATIENLLHMESGIPDPNNYALVMADPLRYWTPEENLATVPAARNKPGERYEYEDANYQLLALVVKDNTGMNVATALRSHILADPRLSSLVYQPEEKPAGPLALPFVGGQVRPNIIEVGGGYLPTMSEASGASGSSGMASDSGTLALWGYLLFGRDLLSEQSLLAMTDFSQSYSGYGLGVFDQTYLFKRFGVKTIGNGGTDVGSYSTTLNVLPTEGIVITVMTNTAGSPIDMVVPVTKQLLSVIQK